MTQKGTHTWDLVYQYHRCPQCGSIIESRDDYKNLSGKLEKNLFCPQCNTSFTLVKNTRKERKKNLGL